MTISDKLAGHIARANGLGDPVDAVGALSSDWSILSAELQETLRTLSETVGDVAAASPGGAVDALGELRTEVDSLASALTAYPTGEGVSAVMERLAPVHSAAERLRRGAARPLRDSLPTAPNRGLRSPAEDLKAIKVFLERQRTAIKWLEEHRLTKGLTKESGSSAANDAAMGRIATILNTIANDCDDRARITAQGSLARQSALAVRAVANEWAGIKKRTNSVLTEVTVEEFAGIATAFENAQAALLAEGAATQETIDPSSPVRFDGNCASLV